MKKHLLLFLFLPSFALCQQRLLINPNNEVFGLNKGESALSTVGSALQATVDTPSCSVRQYGYSPDLYPTDVRFLAHRRDVMAMWFIAPASGTIDSIFWMMNGFQLHGDSILWLRLARSNISPGTGPGSDPYPTPCAPWGYFQNTADPINGITPYKEESTDTTWVSTVPGGVPSFPPIGQEMFFDGNNFIEIPTLAHTGLNTFAISTLGTSVSVSKGDIFFLLMRVPPDPQDLGNDIMTFDVAEANAPVPSRVWKFYELPNGPSAQFCSTTPVPYGWIARGGMSGKNDAFAWNWWYSMTVTSDLPPSFVWFDHLTDDSITTERQVAAIIMDCDPENPAGAGVAAARLVYSVNNGAPDSVDMVNIAADSWAANIPGQRAGSSVTYHLTAIDLNGNQTISEEVSYSILSMNSAYYSVDVDSSSNIPSRAIASVPNAWNEISTTGTPINEWFDPGSPIPPQDDGTAGPFDLGGTFRFFGQDVRYAWIGVNGALCLSSNADDTIKVAVGSTSCTHHHSVPSVCIPSNFIGVLYNDHVVLPQPYYGHASGAVYHEITGTKFIAEWDSVGNFFDPPGTFGFQIILDRADNSITLAYNSDGNDGVIAGSFVGIQAEPSNKWMSINSGGRPFVFQPSAGKVIKLTPNIAASLSDGWNLVSVPVSITDPHDLSLFKFAASRLFAYDGMYKNTDVLQNGVGYWIKYNGSDAIGFSGTEILQSTFNLTTGWNLIGSISRTVPVSSITQIPPGFVLTPYFSYSSNGYATSSTITPGQAYWVRTSSAGSLVLDGSASLEKQLSAAPALPQLKDFHRLILRDGAKREQVLYFGQEDLLQTSINAFELPPSPPEGAFDIRFTSGRMLNTYPRDRAKTNEHLFDISLQNVSFPLAVRLELAEDDRRAVSIIEHSDDRGAVTHSLVNNQSLVIQDHRVSTLSLKVSDPRTIPARYWLAQNYPNPFNPTTSISFALKENALVTLKIYTVLGQEVATLLNRVVMSGGEQSAEFDASSLVSGVYYYTIVVQGIDNTSILYSDTKKMVLIK